MTPRTLVVALAATLAASPAPAQVAQYTITRIAPQSGQFFQADAFDLNNAGQAAITSMSIAPGQPSARAARFTPGVGTIDLGSLQNGGISRARGINALGQVVGNTALPAGTPGGAFLFTDGVGMVNLGVLPGDSSSIAFGVNDAGLVVGGSSTGLVSTERPFRYTTTAGMTALPLPPGTSAARAVAVNNTGQVVVTNLATGPFHTYRFTDAGGYQDIGTLGGTDATANDINAAGVVVGQSLDAAGVRRAFRHTVAGGIEDVGMLTGGTSSSANGVNTAGEIVGGTAFANGDAMAFISRNGAAPVDLNTLIGSESGWMLRTALDINDAGQIVGSGTFQGQQFQVFLLTPVPEPSALLLAGVAGLAGIGWRRNAPRDGNAPSQPGAPSTPS